MIKTDVHKAKTTKPEVPEKHAADTLLKFSGIFHEAVGRRKNAVARVRLFIDKKKRLVVNGKDYKNYFCTAALQKYVLSPLKTIGQEDLSVSVKVSGGGQSGQAGAVVHGLGRCLIKMDPELKPTLKAADLLTRDPREKERKKPGLKRARRSPQWSKR